MDSGENSPTLTAIKIVATISNALRIFIACSRGVFVGCAGTACGAARINNSAGSVVFQSSFVARAFWASIGALSFFDIGVDHVANLLFPLAKEIADPVLLLVGLTFYSCPHLDNVTIEKAVPIDAQGFIDYRVSEFRVNRHLISAHESRDESFDFGFAAVG